MGFFSKKTTTSESSIVQDEKKDGAVVEVDEVAQETGLSKVGLIFGEFIDLSSSVFEQGLLCLRGRANGREDVELEGTRSGRSPPSILLRCWPARSPFFVETKLTFPTSSTLPACGAALFSDGYAVSKEFLFASTDESGSPIFSFLPSLSVVLLPPLVSPHR